MQRAARGEDWRDGPRDVWRPRRPLSSHAAAVHESRLSLRLPYHSSGPPTRIARSSRRDSREARTSAEPKGLKGGSEPVRASLQPSRREALAKLREALAKLSVAARLLIVAEFRNPAMGRGCLEAPVWLPRGPGMATAAWRSDFPAAAHGSGGARLAGEEDVRVTTCQSPRGCGSRCMPPPSPPARGERTRLLRS